MIKKLQPTFLVLLFALAPFWGFSQCTYSVTLTDLFSDGWDGAELNVQIDGVDNVVTLIDGGMETFNFPVTNGARILLIYTPGGFENEHLYTFNNSEGTVLFADGPSPTPGTVFQTTVICPDCLSPSALTADNITDNSVGLSWTGDPLTDIYTVQYGPAGFPLGEGLSTTTNSESVVIDQLNSCVEYDFYVRSTCAPDSISGWTGPLLVETQTSTPPGPICNYLITFLNGSGTGWGGASIDVINNGTVTNYTLSPDSSVQTIIVPVVSGLPVTFNYNEAFFNNQLAFRIFDNNFTRIFNGGPNFPQGTILEIPEACASCTGLQNLTALDINATDAVLGWTATDAPTYLIEYGPLGFLKGTGTIIAVNTNQPRLTGLLENTLYNVYVQQVCSPDDTSKAVGPAQFRTGWLNDVGVTGIIQPNAIDNCDLTANELVQVLISNFGQNPQTLFEYSFAVNGDLAGVMPPIDGLFTDVLGNDSTEVAEFDATPYDFSAPGFYDITAWTALETDRNTSNDTLSTTLLSTLPLPLLEDFEASSALPMGWEAPIGRVFNADEHNNPTRVFGMNVFSTTTLYTLTSPKVGNIQAASRVDFDFRYTEWSAGDVGYDFVAGDSLVIEASIDCGETFQIIDAITVDNYQSNGTDFTSYSVSLLDYNDQNIQLRWRAVVGGGDNWLDLDNINITGCGNNFGLQAEITNETGQATMDGSIAVDPSFGIGPFSFAWNSGQDSSVINNLATGEYTVTVTDVTGCTDAQTYTVGTLSSSVDIQAAFGEILLAPNPTTGAFFVEAENEFPRNTVFQLFDAQGSLREMYRLNAATASFQITFNSNTSPGMYFLRIINDDEQVVRKISLQR